MKKYKLNIEAHNQHGTLERILRVIRHRGFQINSINMNQLNNDTKTMKLKIIVHSNRTITLLHSQLKKIIDISNIQIQN